MIRISESRIKSIIRKVIAETINQPIRFRYDKITEWTVKHDYLINEESKDYNWILRERNWDINDYERFINIVKSTPSHLKGFLTFHDLKELQTDDWVTYTLKDYDVAFALHYIKPGMVEICNLVNNSELNGIGSYVLTFAKMQGGTTMDNYRGADGGPGKLGSLYRSTGFDKQTWNAKYDPQYQPEDPEWQFDTKTFGTPDVEGLERSDHKRRYNNPQSNYKQKFDKRVNPKFKK